MSPNSIPLLALVFSRMSAPWHVHSIGLTILLYGNGQVIGIAVGPWLGIRDHVLFGA